MVYQTSQRIILVTTMFSTSCFVVLFASAYSANLTLMPYHGTNITASNENYHLSVQIAKRSHDLCSRKVAPSLTLVLTHPKDKWSELEEIPRRPLQKTLRFTDYAAYFVNLWQLNVYYSGEFAPNSYGIGVIFNTNVTPSTFGWPFYSLSDVEGKEYYIEHTLTSPPSELTLFNSSKGLVLFYKYKYQKKDQIASIWLDSNGIHAIDPLVELGWTLDRYWRLLIKKFWVVEKNNVLFIITEVWFDLLCVSNLNMNEGNVYKDYPKVIGSAKSFEIENLVWDEEGWPHSTVPAERPEQIKENMWPTLCDRYPNFKD